MWTKELWERYTKVYFKEIRFNLKKEGKICKKRSTWNNGSHRLQDWDVRRLTVDEGGRHCVWRGKLRPNIISVFMHNKFLYVNCLELSKSFLRDNSCCVFHWPSALHPLQQWCNIFQTIAKNESKSLPYWKCFYQTVHSTQSTLPTILMAMICGVKYNIKFSFFWCCWIVERAVFESNSKCQRWIHVSNHMKKKWINFFCNVIALLCRNCIFYDSYSLRLFLFTPRWRIIFNLKGRLVLITEMNARPPMSRDRRNSPDMSCK